MKGQTDVSVYGEMRAGELRIKPKMISKYQNYLVFSHLYHILTIFQAKMMCFYSFKRRLLFANSKLETSCYCHLSSNYSDHAVSGRGSCHRSIGRGCMDAALETRSITSACVTASFLGNMMERASPTPLSTPIRS